MCAKSHRTSTIAEKSFAPCPCVRAALNDSRAAAPIGMGTFAGVGGVDNQRQVLVREVDREARLGVALEHLGGPRNLELAVRGRRPVDDVERLLERQAEPLRQRQRFRVEGARDDREIVVHELGSHAGAGAAAMMNRRAHGLEQRLHAREGLVGRRPP